MESLQYIPPGIGAAGTAGAAGTGAAGAKPGSTAAKPPVRRTPFGIHPAAFYVLLAAGHIFLVKAVTD